MKKNTIFVQIASYRDPELLPTIESCLSNAKYPENLVFSIAWQHSTDDSFDNLSKFKNDKRFKIIDIDYKDSKGVCWARNLLQQQYDGEKYTIQLDSHHRFIKDWDVECINMLNQLKKLGFKKPLLTCYGSKYNPSNDPDGRDYIPYKMNFDKFTDSGVVSIIPDFIKDYNLLSTPIRSRFYSAHFCFADGIFVNEVPHDPNLYFLGEEISIAVRAFTHGYDLFNPHKIIVWHEYTRKNRVKHWDDDIKWSEKERLSNQRYKKLFNIGDNNGNINEDFGIFGFGKIRTLKDYEKFAGISFKKQGVTKYTLENNLPPNPLLSDDEFEKSIITKFQYYINIHKSKFLLNDYDFWYVAFFDESDKLIYRCDADINEIKNYINSESDVYKIYRAFYPYTLPKKWIVWTHSLSKGWAEKYEGYI